MAYTSTHGLFRSLTDEEVNAFRQYARDNDFHATDCWETLHPVCRAEWRKLGKAPIDAPLLAEELAVTE